MEGIIYAEYETCGTTSSNKFQPTPVPNLPHVVISEVLHLISLVVFCSAGRLKITNAEGQERVWIEISFMTSFRKYHILHKICHFPDLATYALTLEEI